VFHLIAATCCTDNRPAVPPHLGPSLWGRSEATLDDALLVRVGAVRQRFFLFP
jgi:hypothetical protein